MKKKVLSSLLVATMVAGMMAGCGNTAAPAGTEAKGGDAPVVDAPAAEEGKVLNIQVWNTEWQERVVDYYPGYEKIDETTGKIGDVTVNWTITPSDENAYQNHLDETLLAQPDAADDEKLDLFLIEADYALKYVDTDATMALADLGITDADVADQYQYTKDVVTDANGNLKGISWQGCPGVLVYNRDAAIDVLGTDDPDEVQKAVADWDTFKATAEQMKAKGYQMCSSANDIYRVFSNNVSSKWVVDGKINIDPAISEWVELSKELVDAKETGTHDLWGDDWNKGFYPEGKVFCYFGPAWLIDFCMAADVEGSIANLGKWGATEGPQGFFWGGTWVCAATGTDNPTLVKDIILTMTTDEAVLEKIAREKSDFVNDKSIMNGLATDDSFGDAVLGGQNPIGKLCAGVETVDLSNISAYDQGCNESFQNAMKDYFLGTVSYDEALEAFYKDVTTKYPSLTY